MRKRDRPRGLGAWVRRMERRLADASIRWRHGHAMRRPHAPPQPGRHEVIMVCDHLHPRVNIGRIIRSAEVFGAREVHLIGTRVFDPAPATTALHAIGVRYFDDVASSFSALRREGYTVVVVETIDAPGPDEILPGAPLPKRAALVVGNESRGVSFTRSAYPDARWVTIAQYGATDCLDVSSAAAIALYDYTRQWAGR